MKKLLFLSMLMFGLVANVQATNKRFKLKNSTGLTQTISQLYLTKNNQALTSPSPVASFSLDDGKSVTIDIPDDTINPFQCVLQASSDLGIYIVENASVTFYTAGSPDIYVLQYDVLLDVMTITKQ